MGGLFRKCGWHFEKQNHHKIFAILTFILILFHTFSRSLLYSCNCYVKGKEKSERKNSHNSNNVVVGKGTREENQKGVVLPVGLDVVE